MSSSHSTVIIVIATIAITAAGALILFEQGSRYGWAPRQSLRDMHTPDATGELAIINVVGHQITGSNVSYLRIQVRYTGKGELPLNDTFIQIKTDRSTADLRYRNGTTQRSIAYGFYTQ